MCKYYDFIVSISVKNMIGSISLIHYLLFFLKNDLKVITSLKKIYRSSGQSFRNGTCLTNAECLEMGGASSGSCAGGWLFIVNYI